jgi:hypothetical protein
MSYDDLAMKLLRRGGLATPGELAELAVELTHAKIHEMNDAIRRRTSDRPVKVITLTSGQVPTKVKGYITQERFLVGKTPGEMRDILGLLPTDLTTGARILAVTGPLRITDLMNKGYTHLPGGEEYDREKKPAYPPGRGAGQWDLITEVSVELVEDLPPSTPYSAGRRNNAPARRRTAP